MYKKTYDLNYYIKLFERDIAYHKRFGLTKEKVKKKVYNLRQFEKGLISYKELRRLNLN